MLATANLLLNVGCGQHFGKCLFWSVEIKVPPLVASSWHPGPVPPVEAAVEARRPRPTGRTQARPGDPTMARAWGRGQDQARDQGP